MSSGPQRESVDFLLVQLCRLHHKRAHTLLEGIGLYRGQPPLLWTLWQEESMTQTELAERLRGQPSAGVPVCGEPDGSRPAPENHSW